MDFGFGSGTAMAYFKNRGFDVEGVEISSHAVDRARRAGMVAHHAGLDAMAMLGADQFAFGFSSDVLEHVPTAAVRPSLDEMTRVCSRFLFVSVCPTPAHHATPDGTDLHLTVRPAPWWHRELERHGTVRPLRLPFSRSVRFVVELR